MTDRGAVMRRGSFFPAPGKNALQHRLQYGSHPDAAGAVTGSNQIRDH
jgi:hypothetical protein